MAQHTITFDVFQYAKKLQKAGFTDVQVEAQVEFVKAQVEFIKEQTNAINETIDESLATKQDIKELELKIEATKNELLIKLGSMIVSSLGALIVLMKLFKL